MESSKYLTCNKQVPSGFFACRLNLYCYCGKLKIFEAKKTVGTCSLHVQLHFILCSLAGFLAVLGFSCSGVSWVLLLLVLLSPCPAWQKSLYRPGSLSLPLPHPSLPPPSAYVYIICWSSLRNRNAHGSLCFGSTMWE